MSWPPIKARTEVWPDLPEGWDFKETEEAWQAHYYNWGYIEAGKFRDYHGYYHGGLCRRPPGAEQALRHLEGFKAGRNRNRECEE